MSELAEGHVAVPQLLRVLQRETEREAERERETETQRERVGKEEQKTGGERAVNGIPLNPLDVHPKQYLLKRRKQVQSWGAAGPR